jgi:hypothetical protein
MPHGDSQGKSPAGTRQKRALRSKAESPNQNMDRRADRSDPHGMSGNRDPSGRRSNLSVSRNSSRHLLRRRGDGGAPEKEPVNPDSPHCPDLGCHRHGRHHDRNRRGDGRDRLHPPHAMARRHGPHSGRENGSERAAQARRELTIRRKRRTSSAKATPCALPPEKSGIQVIQAKITDFQWKPPSHQPQVSAFLGLDAH